MSFKAVGIVGVAALAVLGAVCHHYRTELVTIGNTLVETEDQLARLTRENARFSNLVGTAASSRELSRAEFAELLRLRSEVGQLRGEKKDYERALAAATSNQNQTNVTSPQQTVVELVPKDSWTFAGYQSAPAAFESLMWAMKRGDLASFLASLSPEAQQAAAQKFASMTDSQVTALLQQEVSGLSALRLDRTRDVSDTSVGFVISSQESDNGTTRTREEAVLTFTNTLGEWKATGF